MCPSTFQMQVTQLPTASTIPAAGIVSSMSVQQKVHSIRGRPKRCGTSSWPRYRFTGGTTMASWRTHCKLPDAIPAISLQRSHDEGVVENGGISATIHSQYSVLQWGHDEGVVEASDPRKSALPRPCFCGGSPAKRTVCADGFGRIELLEMLKPLNARNGADKVKRPVDLL
jgi:hypothetical protein